MTTFDQIHENAQGYKKGFEELVDLLDDLVHEKVKIASLVRWFRRRKGILNKTLEPLKIELSKGNKENEEAIIETREVVTLVKRAIAMIEDREIDGLNAIFRRIQVIFDDDFGLLRTSNTMAQLNQLEELRALYEKNLAFFIKKGSENEEYNSFKNTVNQLEDLVYSAKHAKDLDAESINLRINAVNNFINKHDINVPRFWTKVPDDFNKQAIDKLEDEISSKISVIRNRYPMDIFKDPLSVVTRIAHDVSADRGYLAFERRSEELSTATEESVKIFNSKYWQITGQRWQRVGSANKHGYVNVKPTHSSI